MENSVHSEMNDILQNEVIQRCIKFQRIEWFGHIQRTKDSHLPKRIPHAKFYKTRRRAKSKMRWIDNVNPSQWLCSSVVEKAKAHTSRCSAIS